MWLIEIIGLVIELSRRYLFKPRNLPALLLSFFPPSFSLSFSSPRFTNFFHYPMIRFSLNRVSQLAA